MAYQEDVNVNLNVLTGTMGGITAILGGMSALTSSFGAIGTEASNTFGTLDGLLVTSTALMTSFVVKSAEAYGQFEQGMKIVQTVSNQTSSAIGELSSKANEMSVSYRTAIGDITDGLQTLGRAGLNSVSEQLEVLESGLQTAKLEGRNLNGVLEELIQNTAMLGGDLKSIDFGEQAEYINTLLVGTSMTAPITSHDISQTLQYAGGTAAAAGANLESGAEGKRKLEDLMGTIAAFAQKGVTGSMAGTALRAFFTKPASQDKSVTAGLEAIGLSAEDLWEDGGESMKKVSEQIEIIQNQMDKLDLSKMDQIEIWGKIVGAKMGQQMMKLDSSTIKDITRDIQDANSAEELAAQTLQTYTQKLSEMQQRGDVAFREFGAKVVVFLQPVVDVINWVLDALSNPIVNTVAFGVVGSLLAHGFRAAYGMIQTVYNQIRELIREAVSGIQQINSLSGGSASGFSQSATQVDYLNKKLHETDSTLQAIQAKALGLKPGYMAPGGWVGDKIPRDTLRIMPENVVRDDYGVMGGRMGEYYSGENADKFASKIKEKKSSLESEVKDLQTELEQEKVNAEAEIDKLTQDRMMKEEQITAQYNERVAQIKEEAAIKDREIRKKYADIYSAAPDKYTKDMVKEQGEEELRKNKANAQARINTLTKQADEAKGFNDDSYTKQINRIYSDRDKRIESLGDQIYSKRGDIMAIENASKNGVTKLQTRLEANTVKVADDWYNTLLAKEELGTLTEEEAYSLKRTREVWEDPRNAKVLKELESQGVKPTFRSRIFNDPSPNDQMLAQAYESGQMQELARARNMATQNAANIFAGKNSISEKASKTTANALKGFENQVKSAGSRLSQFNQSAKMAIERFRRPSDFIETNAANLQNNAFSMVQKDMNLAGKSMTTALTELSTKLNLSAAEFAALFDSETLASRELAGLSLSAELFREELIQAMVPMDLEEEERDKLIIALRESYDAHLREAGAAGGKTFGEATKSTGRFSGAISKAVGFMGGPLMAGMMAVTVAMQAYQAVLGQWQERVRKADEAMSEAQDKLSSVNENIANIYKSEFENISEADIDKIIDYQYAAVQEAYDADKDRHGAKQKAKFSEMYNNEVVKVENLSWSKEEKENHTIKTAQDLEELNETAQTLTLTNEEHIKQLEDNTAALNSATYAFSQALKKKAQEFNDPGFGFKGLNTRIENFSGLEGLLAWVAAATPSIALPLSTSKASGSLEKLKDFFGFGRGGFFDTNSPVLTTYQSKSDYAGSTDFSPIMISDIYEQGIDNGLDQFFGDDWRNINNLLGTIARRQGQQNDYFKLMSNNGFQGMDANSYSMAQMAMKEDPETFQKLAKQMFRYEQERGLTSGHSAMEDWKTGQLRQRIPGNDARRGSFNGKDAYKKVDKTKYTVQDKNLKATMDKIYRMTDGKLSYANILALGQMQLLGDMYSVANEQIYPSLNQTMLAAYENVSATGIAGTNAGTASDGAGAAAANAAIIAGLLGEKFKQDVGGIVYEQKYLADPNAPKSGPLGFLGIGNTMSKEEFTQNMHNLDNHAFDKYRQEAAKTIIQSGDRILHPNWTQDQLDRNTQSRYSLMFNDDGTIKNGVYKDWNVMQDTMLRPITDWLKNTAIPSAYDQSQMGEYGSGKSGGSGGSGGDGSGGGDSDKGSGSKKERVDLVLCNKKEIPKLNVNLFKKPPNFTVLNKNFKLRDIKINSEDKPKAILNAIKNGIIETQKRMDPKIIQDESAEYDPVSATDGSSTPSGTTKTTT